MSSKHTPNEVRHTPGPWRVTGSIHDPVTSDDGDIITGFVRGPTAEIGDANARLIAAAPELLEALRSVQEFLAAGGRLHADALFDDESAIDMINKAIAKAEA